MVSEDCCLLAQSNLNFLISESLISSFRVLNRQLQLHFIFSFYHLHFDQTIILTEKKLYLDLKFCFPIYYSQLGIKRGRKSVCLRINEFGILSVLRLERRLYPVTLINEVIYWSLLAKCDDIGRSCRAHKSKSAISVCTIRWQR